MELSDTQRVLSFESFFAATEKGLRYALVALFGAEDGRNASRAPASQSGTASIRRYGVSSVAVA